MPNAEQLWDVVVVGAGVGGMALATNLARRGYRVAVVEKRPPPAFRVGESLDWEAPIFLRRLGLPVEKFLGEGKATVKHGAIVTNAEQPGVVARFGFTPWIKSLMTLVGRGRPTIHANRELIDVDLLDHARAAGVELIIARARPVEVDGDRVVAVPLDDGRRLTARFFVDASGRAALFRRAFGIGETLIGPRQVVVRARVPHRYDNTGTRVRTDDTLTEPAWVWDISVSQDETDIGVVVTESDFLPLRRRLGSLREVFLHQVGKHDDLDWLPSLITPDAELWTCSFQDLVSHRSHGENWIAVGEAAFVVDALLSSGFTMSLRTGFLAAKIVGEALSRKRDILCPLRREIYHGKTAAQVTTINRLLDVLWFKGRLRWHYPLALNVASILTCNFNLNHLHTRFVPRTQFGLRLLQTFHRGLDVLIPLYNDLLTGFAVRVGLVNRHLVRRDAAGENLYKPTLPGGGRVNRLANGGV